LGAWTASRIRNTGGAETQPTPESQDSAPVATIAPPDTSDDTSGGQTPECASGVVCGGVCCTPREPYVPDQIVCDGDYCSCIYSCATAGCPNPHTDVFIPTGCDDRPEATCNEFCFSEDTGDDGDSGGTGELPVNCGGVDCAPYPGTVAIDVWCQAECRCTYQCSDVCAGGAEGTFFDTTCAQDPSALCTNLGCFA
jgi:hypothetical protein